MTSSVELGRRPKPWYVAIVSGMASYIDAAAIVSSGIALVIYQQSIGITGDQIGVLSALLTLGIAIGALVGGRLGDRFGRRKVFQVTMSLIVLGATLLVFATSFSVLLVGIVLVGFATGADLPVALSTISEAATDKNRGRLLGFSQILWLLGILVTVVLSIGVAGLGRTGGQILFGHVGVVALIVLVLRFTIPESQVWLAARDEHVRGLHTERAERSRFLDLLKKPLVLPFVGLLVFYSLINLSANTGGQFGTFLYVNAAGASVQLASMVGLAVFPISIVLGLVFMRIVDTRLRMPFFYVGAAATIVSLAIPALIGVSVPALIAFQLIGAIGGAFAAEALMKVWTQESFPSLLRSTAQGIILAVARLVAAALALVTPRLIGISPQLLFGILLIAAVIGLAGATVVFRRGRRNEFDVETEIVELAASDH